MEGSDGFPESYRRSVLQSVVLSGGIGLLAPGATAADSTASTVDSETDAGGAVRLGDFETGLDGWTTNGGNELERVSETDVPVGVASGRHGLAVEVTGDTFPMIENRRRVREADFTNNPYLQMHVIAAVRDTDSDLAFRFRLHHSSPRADGAGGSGSSGGGEATVEESDVREVPQLSPRTVQWDLSGLPDEVLRSAKRLGIAWHTQDDKPAGSPRGRSGRGSERRGVVVFDDIRLSDSVPVSDRRRRQRKKMELHRNHGMVVERTIEEQRETFERGTLVFVDGTEVEYAFEVLDDGSFRHTIDGETFEQGGAGA